jgi:hypothetical protein
MFIFTQPLGEEDVCSHVKGCTKYQLNYVGLHLFTNEMDLNVNVFTPFMKLGISG